MRGEHAVAVHHELSPGEAGIGFRAAQHKPPGRVQKDFRILVRRQSLQRRGQHLVGEFPAEFVRGLIRAVLGRKDDSVQPKGFSILAVFHSDLCFSVRAQAPYHPGFPGGGEGAGEAVGQNHRQRHSLRGFRTGVAHHHALISGPQLQGVAIFTEISSAL